MSKCISRSLTCVTNGNGLFSQTFRRKCLFDTQKEYISFFECNLLQRNHRYLSQETYICNIYWFLFLLSCNILNTSSVLEILIMTFFGLAFNFKQWQVLIFARSTGVSDLFKIFKMQSSKSWIDSIIPEISRDSRRQYCPFAQHFLSTKIRCWETVLLRFWLTARSDSSLRKFVFSSFS